MGRLGNRIKLLREKNDYSQKTVADAIGISNVQLSRYESGDRKPDPETISLLADFLNVTTDYLLGRSGNPNGDNRNEEDYQKIIIDPELKRWHRELPKTPEKDLRKLRKLWEIMMNDE
ncbi:helix-turn-helix domain-containing protein [Bacillus norwichensis]|uniref:Helix-turn-helix transcriptional regulator n=1 Tax=Bacillus norwichensis TaxID=2762217 RepID=A0ABR8VP37_9BACI|nr:helix-turn-helix transcriptional regulator [Bacillus norwichensis]MBD8006520.1 helix-turn-helix transcriptional regulator [Bacillus norwichensis]